MRGKRGAVPQPGLHLREAEEGFRDQGIAGGNQAANLHHEQDGSGVIEEAARRPRCPDGTHEEQALVDHQLDDAPRRDVPARDDSREEGL